MDGRIACTRRLSSFRRGRLVVVRSDWSSKEIRRILSVDESTSYRLPRIERHVDASNLALVVDTGVTAGSDVPSVSPPTSATFHGLREDAVVSTSAFVIGKGIQRSDGRVERGEPPSGKLPTAMGKFDC